MEALEQIVNAIDARLRTTNAAREEALDQARQIVRLSANSIRAVHRGEAAEARQLAAAAGQLVTGLREVLRDHGGLYWAGYVQDAQKEYAEACLVTALVFGEALPSPRELAVEDAAYLNGLGEAVGELRRHALDRMRRGELTAVEPILEQMDDLFGLLVTLDYPDAMTGGLRRTCDAARGILERTRGDVTIALRQAALEQALRRAADEALD